MPSAHRRLLWHGMFLFLLGLVTGFAEPHFVNMRMGLAAHLEGVLNGIFLLVLGAAWTEVRLSPAAKRRILDRLVRQLRELAGDYPRCSFWNRRLVAHHGPGPHSATVAGARRDDRLSERRHSDCFVLASCPLGASQEGVALVTQQSSSTLRLTRTAGSASGPRALPGVPAGSKRPTPRLPAPPLRWQTWPHRWAPR